MKLPRHCAGVSNWVRHMPPRVYDNPRQRCVQYSCLPFFLARCAEAASTPARCTFIMNTSSSESMWMVGIGKCVRWRSGEGGRAADEGQYRRGQATGRSWNERPRLCRDPPLSPTARPELGGARPSWRASSARRSWYGNLVRPFTKKMKRHVSTFNEFRCGGPGMPVPCGAEFVAPQTRRHKLKRVSDRGSEGASCDPKWSSSSHCASSAAARLPCTQSVGPP